MHKIGIIGDRESTLCFAALGFTVMEVHDAKSAETVLKNAADSKDFAVLFITEDLACQMDEAIGRYKDSPLPAVTVIPGRSGSSGYGLAAIKKAVERAVGADILK